MRLCNDISPTLRDIVAQFDEENERPSHRLPRGQMPAMEDQMGDDNEADDNDSMLPDSGAWDFGGCHDHEDAYDENCNPMDSISTNYQEVFSCRLGKLAKILVEIQVNSRTHSYISKVLVPTKYVDAV